MGLLIWPLNFWFIAVGYKSVRHPRKSEHYRVAVRRGGFLHIEKLAENPSEMIVELFPIQEINQPVWVGIISYFQFDKRAVLVWNRIFILICHRRVVFLVFQIIPVVKALALVGRRPPSLNAIIGGLNPLVQKSVGNRRIVHLVFDSCFYFSSVHKFRCRLE